MKRWIAFSILLMCFAVSAVAEVDLSGMTREDLLALKSQIESALESLENETKIQAFFDVGIDSVRVDRNSAGTTLVFVVLKNESDSLSVDRIDFNIKCYDAYGELIKIHNRHVFTQCFYDASVLKPGAKSPSTHRWTVYGAEGTKNVDVAITRYHMTDGTTVEIEEEELNWIRY